MRKFIVKICLGCLRLFAIPRNWVYCRLKGVRYDFTWTFCGLPLIQKRHGAKIEIGRYFKACSDPRKNSLGVFQKVMIKASLPGAVIEVGNHVGMSGCTISASRSVLIGNYVMIGSGAIITDSDAHPLDYRRRREGCFGQMASVVIEDDVFIGTRAIILKGVRVGRGSVIGAGAVVVRSVPANSVVVGNPARVVKELVA